MPGVDCTVNALFSEREFTVKGAYGLLAFAPQKGVHPIKKVDLVVILDVPIVGIEALRLKQANFLSYQMLATIDENQDRYIRCFPSPT